MKANRELHDGRQAKRSGPSEGRRFALAALAYLAIAAWYLRAVLLDPFTLLATSARLAGAARLLARRDESMVVSVVTHNADMLLRSPASLLEYGQCFPMAVSHTLGEHMLGTGILAVPGYLASGDPIFAYNTVLLLSLWIAGIAMYLFAREFVGAGAAFVAGLAFAFEPARMIDFAHPFVHGDLWTPLVLLFLHRVFARGGVANTVGLCVFGTLALLQSLYVLVSVAIYMLVYGVYLSWIHRRRLLHASVGLAASALVLAGLAWIVLGSYLETKATWGLLSGRLSLPVSLADAPWKSALVVLVVVALLDRLVRRRSIGGEDPRWCFLVAAVVIIWSAVGVVGVPGTGWLLPSPLLLLSSIIPGLDAVRATGAVAPRAGLAFALLAGYAVVAIRDRLPARVGVLATAVVSAVLILERFYAPVTAQVYGPKLEPAVWSARPAEQAIALLRSTTGPILHLPFFPARTMKALANADYLRLVSYSPRPTSACYNSFPSPLDAQIAQLASQLPDADAAEALFALGFRTVLVHGENFWPSELRRFERGASQPQSRARLHPLGRTGALSAYRLTRRAPHGSRWAMLLTSGMPAPPVRATPGRSTVAFTITNRGNATFVHPQPFAPSDLVARWSTAGGAQVSQERVRALLPLALAARRQATVEIALDAPARPGDYVVTLALAANPHIVVAKRKVGVVSAAAPDPGAARSTPRGEVPTPPV